MHIRLNCQTGSQLLLLIDVNILRIDYTFIVLCASAMSMAPFTDKRGAAGAVYSCSQMALAFAVNSAVSSLSGNAVTLLGTSFILLPSVGLFLSRRMQGKRGIVKTLGVTPLPAVIDD